MKRPISILNVPISQLNYSQLLSVVKKRLELKKQTTILVAATHFVMECQKDEKLLKESCAATVITPDGMPLVWLSKLFGTSAASRVYGPNLTLMLCDMAARLSYSVYFLGGAKGQSEILKSKMIKKYPLLKIAGASDTPIRPIPPIVNKRIIDEINTSKADIVIVGLGCPLQEKWILGNASKVSARVLVGVGAAFDFITGYIKQAPVWVQNSGFEWLFRLSQDPKRLLKRYTKTNAQFCFMALKQVITFLLAIKKPR